MKDFDFKPDVLSSEYVKEHGTLYDDYVFYSENEECEALFDKKPELGGKPFTGLLYELYLNGNLRWYQYYKDGFGDGEYVAFYDSGAVASYTIMEGFSSYGKAYKWHRNGRLKSFHEKDDNDKYIRTIRFDENGNITYWLENGIKKIDKGR